MKEKQMLAQLLDEEKFLAEFKGVTCWNIAVKTWQFEITVSVTK